MSNSINAKDITKLMDSTPEELKKGIKDIDLRTIDKDIIQEIVKKINVRSIRDLEKNIEQIYILITNPKGGIDINSKIFNNYIIGQIVTINTHNEFIKILYEIPNLIYSKHMYELEVSHYNIIKCLLQILLYYLLVYLVRFIYVQLH